MKFNESRRFVIEKKKWKFFLNLPFAKPDNHGSRAAIAFKSIHALYTCKSMYTD